MWWLLCVLLAAPEQAPAALGPIDVSSLKLGTPAVLAGIDTGQLNGELRRLVWSPDGRLLYLQSAEGKATAERRHHFTIALEGGALIRVEAEPDWAAAFWTVKQDRTAPGVPALIIEIEQAIETIKAGTGPSGVLDRTGSPDAIAGATQDPRNLADGTFGNQKANVVRLKLLGQEIAVFVNEAKPQPGTRFSWGPDRSGALVFLGQKGELIFFDQKKHKRPVPDVKGAFLPAWSADGSRVAYVQKTGRKTYLAWLAVTR